MQKSARRRNGFLNIKIYANGDENEMKNSTFFLYIYLYSCLFITITTRYFRFFTNSHEKSQMYADNEHEYCEC